jgi:serine/threonine-protein kinase
VDPYGIVGQVLDGQFHVTSAIGEGGFSVVYRGQHVGLDEPVAVKCLKLQAQLGSALVETFVRRFRDESKIHYRLSQGSLHIVRTIAAGTTMAPATGALVPYMVLEWLDGFTLAEELRARRHRGERGRSLTEVIRFLDPVAEAMAYAHAQGVVHRDLNPSNIFVAHVGGAQRLKVLDFGVAKIVSDHALSLGPRAATLGIIKMFTPAYGAPEQFDDSIAPVSPATDVYAFAIMVAELLSDRAPPEAAHIGEYADRALDPDRRPTARGMGAVVGDAVESVLERAVSIDPARRPGDVGEFWGMLKNAVSRDLEARAAATYASARGALASPLPSAMAAAATPQPSRLVDAAAGRYKHYSSAPPPATPIFATSASGATGRVSPTPPPDPLGATVEQMRAPRVPDLAVPQVSERPALAPANFSQQASVPPMELAYGPPGQILPPAAPIATPAPAPAVRPPRGKTSVPLIVAFALAITVLLVGVALVLNEFAR